MTTVSGRFAWRNTVEQLMERACEEKVLRGGLETVQHFLNEARAALQRKNDRVWASRINYREAHVCMRMAGLDNVGGNREKARDLYTNALALFGKIPARSPYAWLARVYAVPAALHAGQISAGDYATCRERLSDLLSVNYRSTEEPVQLDANFINLVELSAYYAGFWDTRLEGFPLEPAPKHAYTVMSNDGSFAEICMTRACAFAEVEDLAASGQCDFAVRIEQVDPLLATWWYAPEKQHNPTADMKASWKPVTYKALIPLLVALLKKKNGADTLLWHDEHEPDCDSDGRSNNRERATNRYRIQRQRLRDWLSESSACITKPDGTTTIYGTDGGIHPDLHILVACPENPQFP